MKNFASYTIAIYCFIAVSILATGLAKAEGLANKTQTKTQTIAPVQTKPVDVQKSKIDDLKEKIKKNPTDLKLIIALAREFYNNSEYDKTTALLWKQIDKLDREAVLLLIKAHEKRKEAADMTRAASLLTAKDEKDYEAYSYLGEAALIKKSKADALENFKHAIEINPKYQPAYDGLIKLYDKNLYELRLIYQDMVAAIGPRVEYLTKLCTINVEDVQADQAEPYCQQVVQKNPNIAESYVNLGKIAKLREDNEKAILLLKDAANKFPKSELAQYEYARMLEEKKNYPEAAKYYEACTKANEKADSCWVGWGTTGIQIEKFEQSYAAFKNACKYNKKHSVAIRKSITVMQSLKVKDWLIRFEDLANQCARL